MNECLEKGENLYQDLVKVLLRFRTHRIALLADIEKAFLQISIAEKDRDAFRFLWFKEKETLHYSEEEIQEWRMTRVPFGATCSPYLLTATILHHLKSVHSSKTRTAKLLSESFYVDDLVAGAESDEEALQICREAKEIMQQAGMTLRKWTTNSDSLIDALEHEEQ